MSRVTVLISDYDLGIANEHTTDDEYVHSLMLLLEAIYFFYNVDPTVPSSLRVSQAAIQTFDFFTKKIPERKSFLSEQLVRWTAQFVKSLGGSTAHKENDCVPLEAVNILLVLGEVGRNDVLAQQALISFCGSVDALNYFEIVSYLFCMKDDPSFNSLRDQIFDRVLVLIDGCKIKVDAHAAHLALDILACPYLDQNKRAALFNRLRGQVGLAHVSNREALAAIAAFEQQPWFVNWHHADLLRMIRKKELSAVY